MASLEIRMTANEQKTAAHGERLASIEDRLTRIVWQCRRIVKSVVRQFTGKPDDED